MRFGAEAPFMRPSDLSDDLAPTGVVVQHAIQWLEAQGAAVVNCCCIYATAPFVTAELIAAGYERLIWNRADFAVSVTSFPFPVQRACHIRDDRLQMIDPSAYLMRSQDLEDAYHDAGQLYWGRAQAWTELRPILGASTVPVTVPRHRVQDIDTPEDWEHAELLFEVFLRRSAG